jgi:predicted short-subunit dehydrogenase-like oxidoreductase (DUF2520 family)
VRVFILGAGRVGRGLAGALRASGIEIVGLHGRRSDAEVTAGALPPAIATAEVIVVAVRDAQLDDALHEIASSEAIAGGEAQRRGGARRTAAVARAIILHVSGGATPRALDELRLRGHPAGTFHPLVPIAEPAHAGERLRGAWIGIDGDPAALDASRQLAGALGASTLRIPRGEKARYHAAAVLASNFPAVLAALAAELMRNAGVPVPAARGAVTALLRASVANLHDGEPAAVLTGPIARGDVATVRAHLDALGGDPLVEDVYRALSVAAVRLLAQDGADRPTLAEIDALLRK